MKENDYYLNGLRKNDPKVIREIVENCMASISGYVHKATHKKVKGSDVFFDALTILFEKLLKGEVQLTTNICGYLFGISKNLTLKILEQQKKVNLLHVDDPEIEKNISTREDDSPEEVMIEKEGLSEQDERLILGMKIFNKLSKNCQKLLSLYYREGKSLKEIEGINKWKPNYAKVQKKRCLDKAQRLRKNNQ